MSTSKKIPKSIKLDLLTECGYRCSIPTCRAIIPLNMHHIVPISDGGGNTSDNLIVLCANCHGLYHNGVIQKDSMLVWKAVLISLNNAYDKRSIDALLFLEKFNKSRPVNVSGEALMQYSSLFVSGLIDFEGIFTPTVAIERPTKGGKETITQGSVQMYRLFLTEKGEHLVKAWKAGNKEAVKEAMSIKVSD